MDKEKGEWLFFVFVIIAFVSIGYSIYLSFTTEHWYTFIGGFFIAYLVGKYADPKRKNRWYK